MSRPPTPTLTWFCGTSPSFFRRRLPTLELAARSTQEQSTTLGIEPRAWLFPGARPGSHFYAGRLSTSLNKNVGIFVRPARGAALSALAADLPAPVLADLLGCPSPPRRDGAHWPPGTTPSTSPRASSPRRREPAVCGRCPGEQRIVVGAHT